MKHIPNIISLFRILLIPFIGYFIWVGNFAIALPLLILSGLSDFLDGKIARKYHWVTNAGKILDPIADKLMQIVCVLALWGFGRCPDIIVIVIFLKEFMMLVGNMFLWKKRHLITGAKWFGKLSTIIFYLTIYLCVFVNIFFQTTLFAEIFTEIMMVIATGFAVYALIKYFKYFRTVTD